MRNNIFRKIIASVVLGTFVLSNSAVIAMENSRPIIREGSEYSLQLKGEVNYIKSTQPVTLSLRDSDVKQVLRMFADQAGLNIIFQNDVSGNVTLDLVDVPLNKAFDMVMQINELNYVVEDNTLIVMKAGSEAAFGKQNMTLVPVKYINAATMADFLNKNIFAMKKPGLSGSEIVTTNPVTNELLIFGTNNDVEIAKKVVERFDRKPLTTSFKVNHTTPAEMADMICNLLMPATGGGSSTGGAAGVMTGAASDSGSEVSLNAGTIACTMDGKAKGTEIEAFGLQNLTVAYYDQLGTINVTGGSEHQIEMIREFIEQTDKKHTQAYLEIAIIELNESGSKSLQNTWNFFSSAFSASFDGKTSQSHPVFPVFLKGNKFDVYDSSSGAPSVSHTIEKFKGPASLSYAISYLVENSKGRVVASPKILITNGESTSIDITEDYVETTQTEQTAYAGGPISTRTYNIGSDAGIKVDLSAFISPDGYVTLNLKPEYSTILEQIAAKDENGDYIAATLLSHRNLDLKNIRIKDGETLVIAGLINERETKHVGKVPVLGDIPGIGALFRSTNSEKSKNEMVIMITPKIITDTEDAVGNADTL